MPGHRVSADVQEPAWLSGRPNHHAGIAPVIYTWRSAPHQNPGNHFGAFAFLYTPHRALTHSLQRLVIKFPRVIFSHASMESFATHQVKKNVLLFMNCLIQYEEAAFEP